LRKRRARIIRGSRVCVLNGETPKNLEEEALTLDRKQGESGGKRSTKTVHAKEKKRVSKG